MKKVFLPSVSIIHPNFKAQSPLDVLIENGKITAIGENLKAPAGAEQLPTTGAYLAPGFFDLHVNFGEPGLETKEDISTGCRAALAGGVTSLALMPNTQPALQSKSEIAYIVNKAAAEAVNVYPIGTISEKRKGENLAELYDMQQAGALAFSDGNLPVQDAGLMSRALLYAKGIHAKIIAFAEDAGLSAKALINEGPMSTLLGLKGNPALAEELMISRDMELAAYHDTAIHFSTISSARSVQLIREAKAKGIKVSCDVAAHHLIFTEEVLTGFDSNFKVKPPLRTETDRLALLAGLKDGTIDAIVSQHTPHEIEHKAVEFALAADGAIALQTLLPMVLQAGLSPQELVEKLAINPRKIMGIALPEIAEGAQAELVLFHPTASWTFDASTNLSRSANSPLFGQQLTGKVLWACNNGIAFYSK